MIAVPQGEMCWSLLRFPLRLLAWSEGPRQQANPDGTWMAHARSASKKIYSELRKLVCPRQDSNLQLFPYCDIALRDVPSSPGSVHANPTLVGWLG